MSERQWEKFSGERVWWCEYPEFNDPECMTGMDTPRPQEARMPWKHANCRWVWIAEPHERGAEG